MKSKLTRSNPNPFLPHFGLQLRQEGCDAALGHLGFDQPPEGLLAVGRQREVRGRRQEERGEQGWDTGVDAELALESNDRLQRSD